MALSEMGPTTPSNRTIVQALLEELWKELDTVVEHIMAEGEPEYAAIGNAAHTVESMRQYGEWRGQAQGLAYALAVLNNPYQPNVDKIRAEAMERYEKGEEE